MFLLSLQVYQCNTHKLTHTHITFSSFLYLQSCIKHVAEHVILTRYALSSLNLAPESLTLSLLLLKIEIAALNIVTATIIKADIAQYTHPLHDG